MSTHGLFLKNLKEFETKVLKQFDKNLNKNLKQMLPVASDMAKASVKHPSFLRPVFMTGLIKARTSAMLVLESQYTKRLLFYTDIGNNGPTYAPFPFFGFSTSQKIGPRRYTELARSDFMRRFRIPINYQTKSKFPLIFNPYNINRGYKTSPNKRELQPIIK